MPNDNQDQPQATSSPFWDRVEGKSASPIAAAPSAPSSASPNVQSQPGVSHSFWNRVESTHPVPQTSQDDSTPDYVKRMAATNPNEFGSGRFNAYAELGEGAIKGFKETTRGTVELADKAANWINRKLGTSELHAPVPFQGQDLEGKTPTESLSKGAEGMAEFLLGDEALKGMTLVEQAKHLGDAGRILEKSPKLAKAVEIGANALRQGTVGGFIRFSSVVPNLSTCNSTNFLPVFLPLTPFYVFPQEHGQSPRTKQDWA